MESIWALLARRQLVYDVIKANRSPPVTHGLLLLLGPRAVSGPRAMLLWPPSCAPARWVAAAALLFSSSRSSALMRGGRRAASAAAPVGAASPFARRRSCRARGEPLLSRLRASLIPDRQPVSVVPPRTFAIERTSLLPPCHSL